jgi:hypothetical protein
MPLERMGDADPDLVEGGRGFCKKCLEIHVECPSTASLARLAASGDRPSLAIVGARRLMAS